jgi:quercetin dioxygenase-like cupin family protein
MSRFFPKEIDCGHHTVFGNVPIRTYAGDHLQLSLVDIPADGIVDWHSHPQEQMGMMLEGRATFFIGDERRELAPGDFYLIPGGVRHKVIPIDGPGKALDVFSPVREEYR